MIGQLIGGLRGQDTVSGGYDAQKASISAMIDKLDKVGMPPDQSALLILDQYQQAGILTPQLEQALQDSVTEFKNIKRDEGTRQFQVKALQQMAQYGRAGLTPDEAAEMRKARQGVQQDLEAKQQQIIQNLAARGQAGGGAEIAARLGASQAAADRASEEGDRISSLAAQRALQAIAQQSGMASNLRNQDYGEESARASAMDQMQRFNVQNQMGINQRNVASQNTAQAANLANKQSIANQNVGQSNQEKYNQLQRQRQNWLDKLAYAQSYQNPLQQYGQAGLQQAMSRGQSQAALGKAFDDTIWNVVGMMYGKAPSKTSGGGGELNPGKGSTDVDSEDVTGKGWSFGGNCSKMGGGFGG